MNGCIGLTFEPYLKSQLLRHLHFRRRDVYRQEVQSAIRQAVSSSESLSDALASADEVAAPPAPRMHPSRYACGRTKTTRVPATAEQRNLLPRPPDPYPPMCVYTSSISDGFPYGSALQPLLLCTLGEPACRRVLLSPLPNITRRSM